MTVSGHGGYSYNTMSERNADLVKDLKYLSDVGDGIFECESSCKANGSVAYGTRKIGKQYI